MGEVPGVFGGIREVQILRRFNIQGDVRTELTTDAKKELADAKNELADAEKELADAETKRAAAEVKDDSKLVAANVKLVAHGVPLSIVQAEFGALDRTKSIRVELNVEVEIINGTTREDVQNIESMKLVTGPHQGSERR